MTSVPRRAAFIVGVPRSGTTLLVRLLDGHPQVFAVPYETHASDWVGHPDPAFGMLEHMARAARLESGSSQEEELLRSLRASLRGPADLRSLLRAIVGSLHALRPTPGAEVFVEKTPKHLRVVPELERAFGPETRFVAMLRDPRAVLVSRRTKFRRHAPGNVRHLAQRWALADSLIQRFAARFPHFLAVRYEDLVGDVEGVTRRVADHLAIHWDAVLMRPTHWDRPWLGNSAYGHGTQGEVTRASVDRWRTELGIGDIALLELLLRDRMRAWGYEPDSSPSGRPALRRLAVEAVTALRLGRHRFG